MTSDNVDYAGMNIPASFGDSRLNNGRMAKPVLHTFVQYLTAFCSRPEAANDIISSRFGSPIAIDKCVKCRDPCLNRTQEIPPEAVGGGIFLFFAITSERK